MPWFQKLCRNAGLMIHNIAKPAKGSDKPASETRELKRVVEEKAVDKNITLRRTTIEEVEMKPGADKDKLKQQGNSNS